MAGYLKVCIVAEGCYPYVVGGVSSWIHSLINSFPETEFILLTIVANRSFRGKFVYDLPENLVEVHELYLEDEDWCNNTKKKSLKLDEKEYDAIRSLVLNQKIDWDTLFHFFRKPDLSLNELLMGPDFFRIVMDCYNLKYNQVVFSDFLWTMRSIYLPLFHTLLMDVPKADLYHCVATGYAGVLGSMAHYFHGSRLLISEHGIYTREREEELIKAKWVKGIYKNVWIEQFRKMSKLAYDTADLVTSLYEHARELQIELGCPEKKTIVTPNGINIEGFDRLPPKLAEDKNYINLGAVLRVTPIKDVKTMIQAFAYAKMRQPRLKLWVMGPYDEDKEYAQECFDLVEAMQIKDIVFTGRINVKDYLGRMDMTILTSISEGQPLTILESYAAHKPVIATDVGNCRGLIYGEGDDFGDAGILTHIMNIEEISYAILELANNSERRMQMGENGYQRLMQRYKLSDMKKTYNHIYTDFEDRIMGGWEEPEDKLPEDLVMPEEKFSEDRAEPKKKSLEDRTDLEDESVESWADLGDESFEDWADLDDEDFEDWADLDDESFENKREPEDKNIENKKKPEGKSIENKGKPEGKSIESRSESKNESFEDWADVDDESVEDWADLGDESFEDWADLDD